MKLELIKATEADRITPKAANANGVDYEEYKGVVFEPWLEPKLDSGMVLVFQNERGEDRSLRTSPVVDIADGEEYVVATRNTVYFFKRL